MPDASPPNVLIFLTDQQRWDAMGCAGNPHIRTPNLDRLAAGGARFCNNHTNNPICIPARATLISGAWSVQTGIIRNQGIPTGCIGPAFPTLPRILGDAGYHCEAIGKMHYVPPRSHNGFHRMQLMEEVPPWRQDDEYLMYLDRVGHGHVREVHGVRREFYMQPQISPLPAEHHGTNWVGDRVVDFVHENKDRPFFCLAGFIAPHPPWNVPEDLAHLYDPATLPLPKRREAELAGICPITMSHQVSMELADVSDEKLRLIKAQYYTMVSMVDAAVGRVLDALDQTGQADNTVVIFTSDHGEMLGDHWSWQKKLFYDASVKTPMLVRWPGRIAPGTVCDALTSMVDVLPTVLDAAGLAYPGSQPIEGHSLLGLLDGEHTGREILFGETDHGSSLSFMARDHRYKYVYYSRGGFEELYDTQDDPDEFVNLASQPSHESIRLALRSQLTAWLNRHGYERALDGSELAVWPDDQPLRLAPNRQDARWPENLAPDAADTVQSADESLQEVEDLTKEAYGHAPRDPWTRGMA